MSQSHKIETLQDILNLSKDEFARFLPDFAKWYEVCHATADLLETPLDALGASMEWIDDGANDVKAIRIKSDGMPTVDLMDESTWPKPDADK